MFRAFFFLRQMMLVMTNFRIMALHQNLVDGEKMEQNLARYAVCSVRHIFLGVKHFCRNPIVLNQKM